MQGGRLNLHAAFLLVDGPPCSLATESQGWLLVRSSHLGSNAAMAIKHPTSYRVACGRIALEMGMIQTFIMPLSIVSYAWWFGVDDGGGAVVVVIVLLVRWCSDSDGGAVIVVVQW